MDIASRIRKLFGSAGRAGGFSTSITNVNIIWGGGFHTLDGLKPESNTFEFTVPFDNSTVVRNLPTNTFKFADTSVTITGVTVDPPFQLVGVTPTVPVSIKGNEKVSFKLTIKAPQQNYSGPMTIRLAKDEGDMVKVEINKVTLVAKGRRTDIENSSVMMKVRKNHIFKNSIQLYKALSFQDEVRKVSVNSPFTLVSSEPKVPFRIDNINSYIVDFYIQAPEISYAGALEITLS